MEGFIVDLGYLDGAEAQVRSKDEEEDECACVGWLETGGNLGIGCITERKGSDTHFLGQSQQTQSSSKGL